MPSIFIYRRVGQSNYQRGSGGDVIAVGHGIDPFFGGADKLQHFLNLRDIPQFFFDFCSRHSNEVVEAEDDVECFPDRINIACRDACPSHADDIDALNNINVLLDDKGRDILATAGKSAQQSKSANSHKLMDGCVACEVNIVGEDRMSTDHGTIGKEAVIADLAIMSDVCVGHQVVVVADPGHPGFGGSPMDRDKLTKCIIVADFNTGGLALVAMVLGRFPQNTMTEDLVIATHGQGAKEMSAGSDHTTGPYLDLALNNHMGPNLDIICQLSSWINDGGRVNSSRIFDRHGYTRAGRKIQKPPMAITTGLAGVIEKSRRRCCFFLKQQDPSIRLLHNRNHTNFPLVKEPGKSLINSLKDWKISQ